MNFSTEQRAIIRSAQARLERARLVKIVCVVVMLLVVAALFAGVAGSVFTAVSLMVLAMVCSASTQLGGPPRYEDLAALLTLKLDESEDQGGASTQT